MYGPAGARLIGGSELGGDEPPLQGHPGAGYLVSAEPKGQTTFTVIWDAPHLATVDGDELTYQLTWIPIAAHEGDRLRVRVDPPRGWTMITPMPHKTALGTTAESFTATMRRLQRGT